MDCIIYLVRNSQEDIEMLNISLFLLQENLLKFTKGYDVIVFHEVGFEEYKKNIKSDIRIKFLEINIHKNFSEDELLDIPEFFPHPTHGNGPIAWGHPGFSMGYRNMCRFFSGEYLKHIAGYDYYLRLDTDSYILSPLNYDIFEFMKGKNASYGYCAPAIQYDNPLVIKDLWDFSKKYSQGKQTYIDIDKIPEGMMFYTNFEIGNINNIISSGYIDYYKAIDESNGIYLNRWGDAPIKYIGINLFLPPEGIVPVVGFAYQHGAIYNL